MDDKVKKYLEDILIAINEIDIFFENLPKQYDEFCNNLLLRRGIERNIEIIGEAMSRILKSDNKLPITNARKTRISSLTPMSVLPLTFWVGSIRCKLNA